MKFNFVYFGEKLHVSRRLLFQFCFLDYENCVKYKFSCRTFSYSFLYSIFRVFLSVSLHISLRNLLFSVVFKDVTMKVISFSQQGPRAICILSANGVISNVTLRQPDSSGGTLTYEVRHIRNYHHIPKYVEFPIIFITCM